MTDTILCMICQTPLPIDAPDRVKSINCTYCGQYNPNPNHVSGNKWQHEDSFDDQPTREINVNESAFNNLITISSSLLGIAVYVFFLISGRASSLYLLLSSILVLLPIFSLYFVPSHWEKTAKKATATTGERYQAKYITSEMEWLNYIVSAFFMCWYLYTIFSRQIHQSENSDQIGIWIFAIVIGIIGIWVLRTTIKTVATTIGKIFSKE